MSNRAMCVAFLLSLVPSGVSGQVPLGAEFRVNSYTTNRQSEPSVSCGGYGECVVVWNSLAQDGDQWGVFGQRYNEFGATVGAEFPVNVNTAESQQAASVAVDALGRFMVVWNGRDDDYGGVFGRQFDASGTPGPEFRVNSYTTGPQFGQRVSAVGNGFFVVVWADEREYGYLRLFGNVYDAFGQSLSEFEIGAPAGASVLAVAGNANSTSGDFVVTWVRYGYPGGWDIFGQRFNFGFPLGPEFRVNSYNTGGVSVPSVGMGPTGNFVVVWQSIINDADVSGQRFLASGAREGAEFQVNAYTTEAQGSPVVAVDADDKFVVAWMAYGQDGSGASVFARSYDASATPGAEFRLNTYTTGHQHAPSIASNAAAFVVAWQSDRQDGSNFGVFGQRFSTDLSLDVIFKDCFSPTCP